MRKRRILPQSVAMTLCPFSSSTRNVVLGSTSVMVPSSSMASSFMSTSGTGPCGGAPAARRGSAAGGAARRRSGAPLRRLALELPRLARLHVVPAAAELPKEPVLHDLALERLERPLDPVAFRERDLDHVVS